MLNEGTAIENVPDARQRNQDIDFNTQADDTSSAAEDGSSIDAAQPEANSTALPPSATPAEGGGPRDFPDETPPWDKPVDIVSVADEMMALVSNHCVLSEPEKVAITLWAIASHDIDTFRIFPKLSLISPEKRCGKTTTLEVIMAFCKGAVMTANTSPAAIFRISAMGTPTLIVDEADTFVKGGDRDLIGIINSGHTKSGARILRCVGETSEPRSFSTWMPMVLASIGDLPPTIMDRSIIINLRRKKPSEHVTRIPPDLDQKCTDLRRKLQRWRADNRNAIMRSIIEPEDLGNDRAQDNWVPLFAMAESISPGWLEACKSAYRALTVALEPEAQTLLLRDIRDIFRERPVDRIRSSDLIDMLIKDPDKGWSSIDGGGRLTPKVMVNMLAPYKIKPVSMKFDGRTGRGYNRKDFEDAFERYLA